MTNRVAEFHHPSWPEGVTTTLEERLFKKGLYPSLIRVSEWRGDEREGGNRYRRALRNFLAGAQSRSDLATLEEYTGKTRWYAPEAGEVFHLAEDCPAIIGANCHGTDKIQNVDRLDSELRLRDCYRCGAGLTLAERERLERELASFRRPPGGWA